jgi:hypothetical protein
MIHLLIHLVENLDVCGLVGARWCYPIERFMVILKHDMCNKAKLEECTVMGYMYDEAFGFCIIQTHKEKDVISIRRVSRCR